jgi:hypothetical protein
MRVIYQALLWSAVIVIFTAIGAWLTSWGLFKANIATPPQILNWLQHGGVGILLWATLAKQGWNIQTWNGNSPVERVDQKIFRSLYVVGSFCFFLSIMIAQPNQTNAEQTGTGQPATRPVVEPEGGVKPQPEAEGRSR